MMAEEQLPLGIPHPHAVQSQYLMNNAYQVSTVTATTMYGLIYWKHVQLELTNIYHIGGDFIM
jgi:hypothetical protein